MVPHSPTPNTSSGHHYRDPRTIAPLPQFWPFGTRFRGQRISALPAWYIAYALENYAWMPAPYRCALVAASASLVMFYDQWEGR